MKRMGRLLALAGVLMWLVAPARAAFINWTGESFAYGTSSQATSGCELSSGGGIPLGCYASFPDAATTRAFLPFVVPQDLPSPYQIKCTLGGYSTDGTAGQYAVFNLAVYVQTPGTLLTETGAWVLADFQAQIAAQSEWVYQPPTPVFFKLGEASSGSVVDCTATCLGKRAMLMVTRQGTSTSPNDNLTGSFRVTSVTCEY